MSELEKIKRDEYQRKRKKIIWIQMLIVGILTLATIITSTLFISNNKNASSYVSNLKYYALKKLKENIEKELKK